MSLVNEKDNAISACFSSMREEERVTADYYPTKCWHASSSKELYTSFSSGYKAAWVQLLRTSYCFKEECECSRELSYISNGSIFNT